MQNFPNLKYWFEFFFFYHAVKEKQNLSLEVMVMWRNTCVWGCVCTGVGGRELNYLRDSNRVKERRVHFEMPARTRAESGAEARSREFSPSLPYWMADTRWLEPTLPLPGSASAGNWSQRRYSNPGSLMWDRSILTAKLSAYAPVYCVFHTAVYWVSVLEKKAVLKCMLQTE